ncbi:MAG: hypothetical protein P8J52_07795 [Gammaproteobacteria bacterium]|nr:hypothetical protein [Gammaproteobacteria bacterium]MDG2118900.1 hypothetical protein [Gammaproteobacteria bacterium]
MLVFKKLLLEMRTQLDEQVRLSNRAVDVVKLDQASGVVSLGSMRFSSKVSRLRFKIKPIEK